MGKIYSRLESEMERRAFFKKKNAAQGVGTILGTLRAIKVRKPLTNFIAGKQLHKIKRR